MQKFESCSSLSRRSRNKHDLTSLRGNALTLVYRFGDLCRKISEPCIPCISWTNPGLVNITILYSYFITEKGLGVYGQGSSKKKLVKMTTIIQLSKANNMKLDLDLDLELDLDPKWRTKRCQRNSSRLYIWTINKETEIP